MSRKPVGEEVRRRFPRLTMSLAMAVIFWIINQIVPPTLSNLAIPGLNINAGTLVGVIALLFTAIFLIRALSDALILSDIVTDIIVKRLGIKEERSPKRAARDAIYHHHNSGGNGHLSSLRDTRRHWEHVNNHYYIRRPRDNSRINLRHWTNPLPNN